MEATANQASSPARRRSAIRRSIGVRILAAIVVVAFVCYVGDMRRRGNAMAQMQRYAETLNVAIGESGVVPLNLDGAEWLGADNIPIDMTTLSRTEIGCLRGQDSPMMIAWTVRLVQVLGVNGRAIVSYGGGRVEPSWVGESQFEALTASQHDLLRTCK